MPKFVYPSLNEIKTLILNKKIMALAITDATFVVLKSDKPVMVDFLGSMVWTL
jgi:hypothetical protein